MNLFEKDDRLCRTDFSFTTPKPQNVEASLTSPSVMEKIPEISFKKPKNSDFEFEIFTLKKLFSRVGRIRFSLEIPHRVSFYHIIFITKGCGVHHIDFTPYAYKEGSILFIAKDQVHAFEINDSVDGFVVIFTEPFFLKNVTQSEFLSFNRLYNYHFHSPLIEGGPDETAKCAQVIEELYDEYSAAVDFATEDILRLQLKLLLLKAERVNNTSFEDNQSSEWVSLFAKFRNSLEAQYVETRNATEYAAKLGISYKHLNTVCKSMTGKTAKEFIDAYVILEIKRHVAMFDVSIKELAYELGFDEPTNLIKFFKRHTHQTPLQFKTALRA